LLPIRHDLMVASESGDGLAHATELLLPRLEDADGAEAISIGSDRLSYLDLGRNAALVADHVAGRACAAVWATPTVEACIAVVGAVVAGVPVVPLNPLTGPRELAHIVDDAQPSLVLAREGDELPRALAAVRRLDVRKSAGASTSFAPVDPEQTAIILYTSGTTGPPKGVEIPHRAIASNLDALAELWEWTAADRLVHALPLFHVHGLVLGILGPLRRGGSVELVPRFSAAEVAAAGMRDATMLFGVPTMYKRLADAAEADSEIARALGRLRVLVSGSAALPVHEHRRIARLTGHQIVERYGLTETLMNTGVSTRDMPMPGYVGRALSGVEVRLVDDEGGPLAVSDDETFGEVVVRGPNLFKGYLNRPEATNDAVREGWFFTGDLATRTADEVYRIVGRRATDLIKSGGYKIGAGEIESVLLEHAGVAEVAVAGLPDDDLGERVTAWVVSADGTRDDQALIEHVARALSPQKRPREIRFVDELPRNALGKVMKSVLVRDA
jgi:malonyl-CoA/methylmalonyl-CoA synthetase